MKTAKKIICEAVDAGERGGGRISGAAGRIEDFFIGNRRLIGLIHLVMFFMFLALIFIPPFFPVPPEEATALNNFTIFARFLFWGLWFPLVLISTVFFGRLWCGIFCPQGAASEYTSRYGLNKPPPSWICWEGTPILSFVFVTILGQVVGVRDYPLPVVEIFGGTMVLAMIVGFIYTSRHRTWCRYLCPIGLLLGVFSRLGMVSFTGKIPGRKGIKGEKTVCPTFIDLAGKSTSRHCIECFRCANRNSPRALAMTFRRPGAEIGEIDRSAPSIYEVVFLFGATGLALGAFYWQANPFYILYEHAIGNLSLNLEFGGLIGKSGPWWVMVNYPQAGEVFNWMDFISITTFMLLGMVCAVVILFMLTAASVLIMEGRKIVLKKIVRMGYIYAPVALISIVLGLGQTLFQTLETIGLGAASVRYVEGALFAAGGFWSVYLAVRLQGRLGPHLLPSVAGIGLVALAWYRVLF